MPLSHSIEEENKPNQEANILQEITDFSDNLRSVSKRYDSYEELEKKIQQMVSKVEVALYEKALEQYDLNVSTIEVEGLFY